MEAVRELVRAGASHEEAHSGGPSVLSIACWEGHVQAARHLLLAGAKVNHVATSDHGLTPLHAACWQ